MFPKVKIRSEFKLTCLTYEGIDAIKGALLAAKRDVSDEKFPITIKMRASPFYYCECQTVNKAKGRQ